MYGGDEVNAVVVDLGSFTVKVGYAGEDTPKHVFPSALGSIDSPPNGDAMEVDGVGPSGRTFKVGTASLAVPQDGLEVISPFSEAGVLEDWDALEALYNHAFKDQLRLDLKEHPLMLGEPSNTPRPVREKQVELLFERYDTPAVFLAKNAVLSAFSTGRQTALVVDAGHAQTMGAWLFSLVWRHGWVGKAGLRANLPRRRRGPHPISTLWTGRRRQHFPTAFTRTGRPGTMVHRQAQRWPGRG
uniref:Actin-related protein 4 n=1 Tax=Auxenochlorella protothecoides TaxID=3075 RepID=A0A1D2A2G0_AUXPR